MKRGVLVAAAGLALAACQKLDYCLRLSPGHARDAIDGYAVADKYRVIMDGHASEELPFAWRPQECPHYQDKRGPKTPMPSAFAVELHTPCGWRSVPTKLQGSYVSETPGSLDRSLDLEIDWRPRGGPLVLYVDNRGATTPARLNVGDMAGEIPAGATGQVTLPYWQEPPCPEASVLRLNGETLLDLKRGGDGYFLVDPGASRCYRFKSHHYGDTFLLRNSRPRSESFRRGRVHRLPGPVQWFLDEAPDKVMAGVPKHLPDLPQAREYNALTQTDCD